MAANGASADPTAILDRPAVAHDALPSLSGPLVSPMGARLYKAQFAPLYDFRLRMLRKKVRAFAQARWESQGTTTASHQAGTNRSADVKGKAKARPSSSLREQAHAKFVSRVLDVQQGDVCYIIGTVYCSMLLKPDVLEDLTRDQWLPPQPVRTKYFDADKDEIFLEDESGRVRLTGQALLPYSRGGANLRNQIVTGVVIGVLGTETKNGDFETADIVFPDGSSALNAPSEEEQNTEMLADIHVSDDQWIALVSGLEVGADEQVAGEPDADANGEGTSLRPDSELRLLMLSEWLSGQLGEDEDRKESRNIVSLILAGNSLAEPVRSDDEKRGTRKALAASKPLTEAPTPPKIFDTYLSDMAATMRVHLLPGEKDPAPVVLPQQPIHHALLPKSARWSLLKRETNPAWFGLGGKKLLGTSGQNIDDIFKYMEEGQDSRLRMAFQTLRWGHVAPTAPDTLWCIPFTDRDPFLLLERPDIYFIGNQPRFATGLYAPAMEKSEARPTRVVLLPRFCETGEVALVNLRTLECKVEKIEVDL
ncbi:hypothetical protein K437DRAFT_246969 [Tilletiaria anomala UBC 951]|uniref:DNA-directed DNA polymerase n=1 Tax=Tilletiaria anomala (strain ATCC 24038 / CBS 436.72 / UBC 951) TaxID=1037660 RepID=A0A066W3T4_TILAU|nr:uncharacterized protein K437DRAFT_246969 [Tilletiaria anomala UBC 951]KDN45749.1 hypothetical protein K437DRAFT_246969 [Tilletiaria anomala UBC 951]